MKTFMVAAKTAEEEEAEILEFAIAGEEFEARLPTNARIAMFVGTMMDEDAGGGGASSAIFALLRDVLLGDGYRRLRKLISDGVIEMEVLSGGGELNENGLVDWIISQATARPTGSPSTSTASPAPSGKRSTGRVRGAASTS